MIRTGKTCLCTSHYLQISCKVRVKKSVLLFSQHGLNWSKVTVKTSKLLQKCIYFYDSKSDVFHNNTVIMYFWSNNLIINDFFQKQQQKKRNLTNPQVWIYSWLQKSGTTRTCDLEIVQNLKYFLFILHLSFVFNVKNPVTFYLLPSLNYNLNPTFPMCTFEPRCTHNENLIIQSEILIRTSHNVSAVNSAIGMNMRTEW